MKDDEEDDNVVIFSLPLTDSDLTVLEDVRTSSYRSTPSPVGSSLSCKSHDSIISLSRELFHFNSRAAQPGKVLLIT